MSNIDRRLGQDRDRPIGYPFNSIVYYKAYSSNKHNFPYTTDIIEFYRAFSLLHHRTSSSLPDVHGQLKSRTTREEKSPCPMQVYLSNNIYQSADTLNITFVNITHICYF